MIDGRLKTKIVKPRATSTVIWIIFKIRRYGMRQIANGDEQMNRIFVH